MIFDQNKFSQILKLYFSGSSKDVGIGVFLAQKAPHPWAWDPTNAFTIVAVVKAVNAWARKGRLISSDIVGVERFSRYLACEFLIPLLSSMTNKVLEQGHVQLR